MTGQMKGSEKRGRQTKQMARPGKFLTHYLIRGVCFADDDSRQRPLGAGKKQKRARLLVRAFRTCLAHGTHHPGWKTAPVPGRASPHPRVRSSCFFFPLCPCPGSALGGSSSSAGSPPSPLRPGITSTLPHFAVYTEQFLPKFLREK